MGLLQEIRQLSEPKRNYDIPPELPKYEPLFMSVIRKRGCFYMSKDSLPKEHDICAKRTGKTFHEWLKENNLNIEEINLYYKIYI